MSLAIRMLAEPVRTVAFGAIGPAYIGIGSGLTHPARLFLLQNLTDSQLMFSFDGIEDHFPLPENGYILLDITTNQTLSKAFFLSAGQRIYVKELGTPSFGSVYLTVFYGKD